MGLVFFLCIALAALGNANNFWSSLAYTSAILSVTTAAVGALTRKDRAPWLGFALAGTVALLAWLETSTGPRSLEGRPYGLFCEWSIELLFLLNPNAIGGGPPLVYHRQVSQSLDVILTGCAGSLLARLVAPRGEPDR